MKEIKMKLIYLWYDFLNYRLSRINRRFVKVSAKIDSLEVKYMGKLKYATDWSKLEAESKQYFEGFENCKISASMRVSDDIQTVTKDNSKIIKK